MTRSWCRPARTTALAAAALAAVLVPAAVSPTAATAATRTATPATVSVAPSGSIMVHARGNGHGHGMSQYGARGAAIKGLSYRQIVGFYYRHATLATTTRDRIRVLVSGYGTTTTVAARPALTVTGVGRLSTAAARYRLLAGGHGGLVLQQLPTGAHAAWKTLRTGLPNQTAFRATDWSPIRVFSPNGTSATYFGRLRAVLHGSGVRTVNVVSIDRYTAGVVPREMPASWPAAAVRAQAVAARTYGVYAVEHPRSSTYDICDTTDCQVYGGHSQLDARGHVTETDDLPAAAATSNQVLTYHGSTIFAQFSASNGGWESSGGLPYLVSQRDPYDAGVSGDPYLAVREKVSARSIASYFGLAKLTGITVTHRDGNGQWGGRVETVRLTGRNSAGQTRTVSAQGYDLQYALGLGTTWYSLSRSS